jgi:hypothetical protein
MTCSLCGRETNGAIGATGLRWPNLCQRCKDLEDHREEEYVGAVASAVDYAYQSLIEGEAYDRQTRSPEDPHEDC